MALLKVKTKDGWVEGIPAGNQMISLFRGIPYAAPPVGELRWKRPQPVKPWDGVLQCYKFQNICWQERVASEGGGDVIGNEFYCLDFPRSEDCLYVNVWTPAKSADEKLPVGVYLHGGGYATGYGFLNCYDGEGLAKRGTIYVTVTHRLNLFGFLAHPELTAEDSDHTSGNYGMFDIIAALEWVRDNIAAFGGDPERVTIFGQSGGGGKVQTLICSPLSNKLMQGAIMQSGGAMPAQADAMTLAEGEAFGVEFLKFCGFSSIKEAREADAETLLNGMIAYSKKYGKMTTMHKFGPRVDGVLLTKSPNETFMAGEHPDIPYMVGCTAQEFYRPCGQIPARQEVLALAKERFGCQELAEKYVESLPMDDPEKAEAYFGNRMGEEFVSHVTAWSENEARINRRPAFTYYITLVPPGAEIAHHSAEHHYVFQTLARSRRPYSGRDWDLSNQLCDYWSNFIKYGNPNGVSHGQSVGIDLPEWKPFTSEGHETLEIKYNPEVVSFPMTDSRRFMTDYILHKFEK